MCDIRACNEARLVKLVRLVSRRVLRLETEVEREDWREEVWEQGLGWRRRVSAILCACACLLLLPFCVLMVLSVMQLKMQSRRMIVCWYCLPMDLWKKQSIFEEVKVKRCAACGIELGQKKGAEREGNLRTKVIE